MCYELACISGCIPNVLSCRDMTVQSRDGGTAAVVQCCRHNQIRCCRKHCDNLILSKLQVSSQLTVDHSCGFLSHALLLKSQINSAFLRQQRWRKLCLSSTLLQTGRCWTTGNLAAKNRGVATAPWSGTEGS